MKSILRSSVLLGLLLSLLALPTLKAAEPKAEDILPDTTLLAIIAPDFATARDAYGKTKLGELYAKPDMQTFLMPIWSEMRKTYMDLQTKMPPLPALEDLDAGLLSGEVAIGVYQRPNGIESPFGVMLTVKPKDPQALLRAIPAHMRKPLSSGQPMENKDNPTAPAFLMANGRLMICVPGVDISVMGDRAAGKKSQDGAKVLSEAPGFIAASAKMPAPALWMYAAPDKINAIAQAMGGDDKSWAAALLAMKILELKNTKSFSMGLTFADGNPGLSGFVGFKDKTKIGVYSLFLDKTPITPDALKIAGAGAPFVSAGHVNFAGIIPYILEVASGDARKDIADGLAKFPEKLGFDLHKDFLSNLGNEIIVAQTEIDTGMPLSMFPGMVISMPAKDPAKIESCIRKLGEVLETNMAAMKAQTKTPFDLKYRKMAYEGSTIYYFSSIALCVADNRLIVGTSLNAVKRSLVQLKGQPSVTTNKDFQAAVARGTGAAFDEKTLPCSFAYSTDKSSGTGTLMLTTLGVGSCAGGLYAITELTTPPDVKMAGGNPLEKPSVAMLLNLVNTVDLGLWPDEGFFIPYRRSAVSMAFFDPEGIAWKSDLPGPGPSVSSGMNPLVVTSVVAIVAAIAIPNLLRSRMAANESAAIGACKTFASAEDTYRRVDYDKDDILEYAQSLQDLYGNGEINLIDRAFAKAEGGEANGAIPKAGYYFKVLKGQGVGAPGGKKSYLNKDNMTVGYALLAWPAKWDGTGRNCFLISASGTIYQKDLGSETAEIVKGITEFDPSGPDGPWIAAE